MMPSKNLRQQGLSY
uniref:Uncharacterized protein n=1 Tax=Anguilla anguilla TaxID=7936 RepID=A0A0E9V6W3_ANGAN